MLIIAIIAIIVIACLLPVVFFRISRGRSLSRVAQSELIAQLRPVDIEAFCNLVDPDEEHFLRTNLPPAFFRSVQRDRLRAATEYVGAVSHNAAILTRIGEAARHHADPSVEQAAHELVNSAVRLRLLCSLVTLNLWAAIVLPGAGLSSTSVVERYRQLNGLARRLGRLRYSSTTSEVSAAS